MSAEAPASERHRLLAIDGDGTRVFLSLPILTRLEREIRRRTSDPTMTLGGWFDYVSGTNTGGVVAALVATGHPMQTIVDRLHAQAPTLFSTRGPLAWLLASRPLSLVWPAC